MSLLICRDSLIYQSYYAQVGTENSYQEGYPFSNCTAYRDKPWLEWRSGFSDQNAHTINIYHNTTVATGIGLFGCNFSSVIVDGSTKTLGYNRALGEYRGVFLCSLGQSETWTIPAQTTAEGYFKCRAIVVGSASSVMLRPIYPIEYELEQNALDVTLESGHSLRCKAGDRKHIVKVNMNPTAATTVLIVGTSATISPAQRIAIYDNVLSVDKCYYCRRANDLELSEHSINNYKISYIYREI